MYVQRKRRNQEAKKLRRGSGRKWEQQPEQEQELQGQHTVHWPMGNLECKHLEASKGAGICCQGSREMGVGRGEQPLRYRGQLPFGKRFSRS